jgi:hypothetical protein
MRLPKKVPLDTRYVEDVATSDRVRSEGPTDLSLVAKGVLFRPYFLSSLRALNGGKGTKQIQAAISSPNQRAWLSNPSADSSEPSR